MLLLNGLLLGVLFGLALEKSRVFEPGAIVNQLRLKNFLMIKVFLTAVITGIVLLHAGELLGLFTIPSPKATDYGENMIGGLIFGVGMYLAGACPGTVLAQLGTGYRDAFFILVGGLFGVGIYGLWEPEITSFVNTGSQGKIVLADLLKDMPALVEVSSLHIAIGLCVLFAGVLYGLESWKSWQQEQGKHYDVN